MSDVMYNHNMTDKHQKIFDLLQNMSVAVEPVACSRHTAAIVYKNEILGFGINRNQTHPFQKRFGNHEDAIYLHAETDALQRVIRKHGPEILPRCTIYVARMKYVSSEKNQMIPGMSKPCPGCTAALATFGVKRVFYTCDDAGYDYL